MKPEKYHCPYCGAELKYKPMPYLSNDQRVCTCGALLNVDKAPIDWVRISKNEKERKSL
jgi:hypothetical protein